MGYRTCQSILLFAHIVSCPNRSKLRGILIKLKEDYYFENNFKTVIDTSLEIGDVTTIDKVFSRDLEISPPEDWGDFGKEDRLEISLKLYFLYLFNNDEKRIKFIEYILENLRMYLEAGNDLFDLYIKKQSSNDEKLKNQIESINNEFYYANYHQWSIWRGRLVNVFYSLNSFLSKEVELGISYKDDSQLTVLLNELLASLEQFGSIERKGRKEYANSDIIKIDGGEMELDKKKRIWKKH